MDFRRIEAFILSKILVDLEKRTYEYWDYNYESKQCICASMGRMDKQK
jgi:hypothetical protein